MYPSAFTHAPQIDDKTRVASSVTITTTLSGNESVATTLPDRSLTPGVVSMVDSSRVCELGFSSTIRPKGRLWRHLRDEAFRRYHISRGHRSEKDNTGARHPAYQIDHLIPVELGGDPTDIRNLWPQPIASAKKKNVVENELHARVCSGQMTLNEAQSRIAKDWTTATLQ